MLDKSDRSKPSTLLEQLGFARYSLDGRELNMDVEGEVKQIQAEFDVLKPDPYGGGDNRFRSYARGILLPWKPEFSWIPPTAVVDGRLVTEYYQGSYNPDFSGERRLLPAISEKAKASLLLRRLIWSDFDRTFWSRALRVHPLQVGLSFIKLQVDRDHRHALSTPDSFHQDGETFTFAHLVQRAGIVGGINAIAAPSARGKALAEVPPEERLEEFVLERPLETYAIFDPLVSHYVSPIELEEGCDRGERSIILVDFTPMVPIHHVVQ